MSSLSTRIDEASNVTPLKIQSPPTGPRRHNVNELSNIHVARNVEGQKSFAMHLHTQTEVRRHRFYRSTNLVCRISSTFVHECAEDTIAGKRNKVLYEHTLRVEYDLVQIGQPVGAKRYACDAKSTIIQAIEAKLLHLARKSRISQVDHCDLIRSILTKRIEMVDVHRTCHRYSYLRPESNRYHSWSTLTGQCGGDQTPVYPDGGLYGSCVSLGVVARTVNRRCVLVAEITTSVPCLDVINSLRCVVSATGAHRRWLGTVRLNPNAVTGRHGPGNFLTSAGTA